MMMNAKVMGIKALATVMLCMVFGTMHAAVLVNEAHVVTADSGVAASLPAVKTFDVAIAGDYTVTLTDVGKQTNSKGANPFSKLSLVIYKDSQLLKVVSVVDTNKFDTVTLTPGTYSAQVLGVTTGASLYSASISNGGSTLFSTAGTMTAASNNGVADPFANLQLELNLVVGHSYSIMLNDISFPAAMQSLQSTIVSDGMNLQCKLSPSVAGPCSFVAGGTNTLFVIANKASSAVAGLYSVKIVDDASGNVVLASTYPVGTLPAPLAISLPANASYQLITTDLKTPDPLNTLQVLLLQDINVLANQNAAGTSRVNNFNAVAGSAKLYVVGSSTNNGGIYGVQLTQGSTVVYSNASVISPGAVTTQTGYFFNAKLPVAGDYSLMINDVNFPQSFKKLSAAVTQSGITIGTLNAAGTLTLINAAAGDIQINVIATPNGSGQGLFGLTLAANGSSTKLLNLTQGVGGSFVTIPVNVTAAGTYKLNVNDMKAPQALGQLLVAVTRDTQFIGEVIGSSSVNVDVTPGAYVLNIIANTDAVANAPLGMYGIAFGDAPAVTLTASAASVTSGGSVFMNWSSKDAASCLASDAWSGSKAATGSETFGPVLTDAKLTLTCTGVTGSVSKSVTVQVKLAPAETPPTKSGGGGALQWWMVCALLMLMWSRRMAKETES